MRRLSDAVLGDLPPDVGRPGYDRVALASGVVHLGAGAFHRAHQGAVFDDLARRGDLRWGVIGASLRSPAVAAQMNPQDGLYSLVVRDGGAESVRVIGAVKAMLVAPHDPAGLVAAMAAAQTHLVTLTVTEKGYKLDPATGELLESDPDLALDLKDLSRPRTAIGLIVAALSARRSRSIQPFTAISCDNLPSNGARLRQATLALARRHDPALADWIAAEGAFPETMVDRITPAVTPADLEALSTRIGLSDEAMVKTEPFTQWVIEDAFTGPRPEFEAVGVQVTRSVAPWETAKLRLLNGAHSAIAYLGGLAGIAFVHQFVAEPSGARLVERLWDEAATTLDPPSGLDVGAYREALMARFSNTALQHQTRQIAMDGSQKLPQRLLAPMAVRLERNQSIEALALAVAAWMRWQGGREDSGAAFAVDDPLADATSRLLRGQSSPADRVRALLSLAAVFPPRLADDPRVFDAVARQLERLETRGARVVWTLQG